VRSHRPFVLIICDGWGDSPNQEGNAIAAARTPGFDKLRQTWPHTTVAASGEAVGLPEGQMGNSEVGHLTIGSGRITRQPLSRQHHEISSGKFFENEVLITAIELAKQRGTALHIMGLISPGGVHSHSNGAIATAKLAHQLGLEKVHVHAFTDGRDTPPASAKAHLEEFEAELTQHGQAHIASVAGRYYAMDRDNRWDRIQAAYDMLTAPEHPHATSATGHIQDSYDRGETDEFIKPTSIAASPADRVSLQDGDVVIFINFRPDRARQLSRALTDPDFTEFKRGRVIKDLHLVTFAEYDRSLSVPVAFPKEDLIDTLPEVVAAQGLSQYHVAETEKYAHVTYFLAGGREKSYDRETRDMIPSPKVATYDLAPEMSADAVAQAVIDRLEVGKDDLIVVNFANADMVGHTGKFDATIQAIEAVDAGFEPIVTAAIEQGGAVLITADHGNAEFKIDPATKAPLTAHTTNPVPVVLCGSEAKSLRTGGGLQDIAPTVLEAMGIEIPRTMTGHSLAN
jgi:2,3-bisphosphoglycerate-independent phosphoglycerate mutase